MAQDDTRTAIGRGAGGTGDPDAADRNAARGGEAAEDERDRDEPEALSGGDASTDAAIGRGGPGKVQGTGSSVELSGRMSSEGTGPLPNPPDAGDPGGMGGVRADRSTPDDRPPGGVSPMGEDEAEDRAPEKD